MPEEKSVVAVTVKKAAELSGLTTHMLTYLGRLKILIPSGSQPGRGRPRLYTFSDVLFLRLIAELLDRGVEVKRLAQALQRVKSEADDWINVRSKPRHFLVTDGTEVFLRRKGSLESKSMNGQLAFAFVLDLAVAHAPLAQRWPRRTRQRAAG
jgi:DNA-binding transcriptional MerR regulator